MEVDCFSHGTGVCVCFFNLGRFYLEVWLEALSLGSGGLFFVWAEPLARSGIWWAFLFWAEALARSGIWWVFWGG